MIFFKRLCKLLLGLFLFALGVVFTVKADIGYSPWDVFHSGLSRMTGLSLGTITVITGAVILLIVFLLREKLGLGTLLNMLLIGTMVDLMLGIDAIPVCSGYWTGIPVLILGLFITALGSYFYIGSGFGAGPRDSLMVALVRITKLPVGVCRCILECSVVLLGWIFGGNVGVGTVLSAFCLGIFIEWVFRIFHFDSTGIKHETLADTYRSLKSGT